MAAATALGRAAGANATTAGFVYFVVVLFVATRLGFVASAGASVAATACFNYYFLPPVGTWAVAEPENWVALAVLLVSSVLVSHLVAEEKRRAEEAEARRKEVEALSAERERFLVERAHLEALRESEALKTSLLRAVSHDLQTPLTAIRLGLERLRRTDGGGDVVEEVARETERLSRRIDNLLAMARVDAGTFAPRPEPAPAADLFRAALETLPLVLGGRPVEIAIAPETPDLRVDPALAVEILSNLLENAARNSPPGASIGLRAGPDPDDARRVRLEVLDRGPGVPAGVKRALGGRDPGDTGRTGLGLEICRSLSQALGGSVSLSDRTGGGTVARVALPAAGGEA